MTARFGDFLDLCEKIKSLLSSMPGGRHTPRRSSFFLGHYFINFCLSSSHAAKGNEWIGTMILIKWAVICYNMVLEIQYAQES